MAHTVPIGAAVQLTHAAVQVVADDAGVDVLHIKGPALDELLRLSRPHSVSGEMLSLRVSTDADILVRPRHLRRMVAALEAVGWSVAYHFDDGSPFRHAMMMVHDHFAPVDVHRRFPGIGADPEAAFEILWGRRLSVEIAGIRCGVPDLAGQRLILVLHSVRSRRRSDADRAYHAASPDERAEVDGLVRSLEAEVAFAAGVGRLEDYRDRREYRLWKAIEERESSRPRLWVARVMAEPTWRSRVETGVALVAPKPDRLQKALGRPPTRLDQARDLASTTRKGVREVGLLLLGRVRGGRRR